MKTKLIFLITIILLPISCASPQRTLSTLTPSPETTVTQTISSTPTFTPSPQPTSIGGGLGYVIYEDPLKGFVFVDLNTGKKKALVSRAEIEALLPENRSRFSSEWGGKDQSIEMVLSPDASKVYTHLCTKFDKFLRCLDSYFIYDIANRNIKEISLPADVLGADWQWAPDASNLIGAGWDYSGNANTKKYKFFYSVSSDGSNLKAIGTIENEVSEFAWKPDGKAIYPLSELVTFREISISDGVSKEIGFDALDTSMQVDCLEFSENKDKVFFAANQDLRKGDYWLYSANSDFSAPVLLREFNSENHFSCELSLSPNGKYVHLHFDNILLTPSSLEYSPIDFVFDTQTGAAIEIPKNTLSYNEWYDNVFLKGDLSDPYYLFVCGWSPDNNLVYQDGEVDLFNLHTLRSLHLSDKVSYCPELWLEKELPFQLADGIPTQNACHPGETIIDDVEEKNFKKLYDILSFSSSLDGEILTIEIQLNSLQDDLSAYLNNRWSIEIDRDNDLLTGDFRGVEYILYLYVFMDGTSPVVHSVRQSFTSDVFGFAEAGRIDYMFKPEVNSIVLSGKIPGISENSRIIVSSRYYENVGLPVEEDIVCK